MHDRIMLDFAIAVEAEVVTGGGDLCLRNNKAAVGARVFLLGAVTLLPAGQCIGEVVQLRLFLRQICPRADLVLRHQQLALIVEAEPIGVQVVEPDTFRAAGVCPLEQQDRGGHPRRRGGRHRPAA